MIRFTRIVGFLLIVTGILFLCTWLIKPLRAVWPWLQMLPLPVKIGLIAATAGLLLLFGSLIWERFENRQSDRQLLDDD